MKRRTKENWQLLGYGLLLLLIVAIIVGALAARVWAPCDWIDWLPVKDVPTRCLAVSLR